MMTNPLFGQYSDALQTHIPVSLMDNRCFKRVSLCTPADSVHSTAVANAVQACSSVVGVTSTKNTEDSNIADWKGRLMGCRWRNQVILDTPADCPMREIRLASAPKTWMFE